jgi:DNA-binding HxlR family transcriptional regulator
LHIDSVSIKYWSMAAIASTTTAAVPKPDEIFDPVGRGLDVIGDRWTLLLVRHLLGAHRGFQELRKRTGIAPRVLSSRLRQLTADGFVEPVADGSRSLYALTPQGRSLAPIIASIGRWWICHGLRDLAIDATRFNRTSAQSVIESLPFMVHVERSTGVDLTFELRLTGEGAGVWTIHVQDGVCDVRPGFAERADVRLTAEAQLWCGVALGLIDARDLYQRGLLRKEGGPEAMDHYFHQVAPEGRARPVDQVLPRYAEKENQA